jgi:SpoVK/Ycf46/Vps4 family AAA+-type ATPase
MRPGRLDRILYVGLPDLAGRMDILRIRTRNMAVEPALDLDALAALVRSPRLPLSQNLKRRFPNFRSLNWLVQTSGCSGAEITAMCQEAALITMRDDIDATFVSVPLLRDAYISISKFCRSRRTRSSPLRKRLNDRSRPRCCESLSAGITNTVSTCWRKPPFTPPSDGDLVTDIPGRSRAPMGAEKAHAVRCSVPRNS